jgi:hypothetical protein
LTAQASSLAERCDAKLVALRDLPADDPELDQALLELGYTRLPAPASMLLEVDWSSREEYLARLTRRERRHQRRAVEPFDRVFRAEVLRPGDVPPDSELWRHLHGLYRNVWRRSLQLNTFALPEDFLPRMLRHEGFEIVTLTRRVLPDAFFAARVGRDQYIPLVVGLDYRSVQEYGAYRQCLAWAIRRAEALGRRRVLLGMGAELEKRRFGARPVARNVWIQSRDSYQAEVLAMLAGDVAAEGSP